jgi:hypothetical protein
MLRLGWAPRHRVIEELGSGEWAFVYVLAFQLSVAAAIAQLLGFLTVLIPFTCGTNRVGEKEPN